VARILIFPLTYKSQKSMQAMRQLQPEMEKIKKKYENKKDPESQKKMGQEINRLYLDNKASPIMGCLPVLPQFPILMSLFFIMNQPYRFINRLGELYKELAEGIISILNIDALGYPQNMEVFTSLQNLANGRLPDDGSMQLDLGVAEDLRKLLARLNPDEWRALLSGISPEDLAQIQPMLNYKDSIETFLGISLVENVSFTFPAILIPIACVVFTFLSSYMMQKNQGKAKDQAAKMQQNMMLVVMPAMMGFITFGMPAGLGLYWAVGSVIQIAQQHFMGKQFNKPEVEVV